MNSFEKSSLTSALAAFNTMGSCSEHIPYQDATISTNAHHLLAVGAESYTGDTAAVPRTLCEKSAVCSVPYAHALVGTSRGKKTPAW